MQENLLNEPAIVVAQLGKFMSQFADYELYRPDGTPLGAVSEEQTLGGMFARKLSTLRFVMTDTAGAKVATIEKPGAFGVSNFLLYDAADQQVGELAQENLMFDPQFTISTADGQMRLTSSAVMAWDWALIDDSGAQVGAVTREFAGLADMFTTAERYVVQLSPSLQGAHRLAALAACVCMDVVRDTKKRR
jgi:uncharacterized protein YxjI